MLARIAWFSKQGWGTGKKISGPICRTGEGRIYIKVVIILFNAFQWFVKRLNPIASLDFNFEQLWTPYGFLQQYPPLHYQFFFFLGVQYAFWKTLFSKNLADSGWGSRGMIRGQESNIIPKKAQFFFLKASWRTVAGNQFLSVVIEGVDLSVCVCKASGNQSWMTLIIGKFVEFPRLVARNLKVDGSNGSLLEHI